MERSISNCQIQMVASSFEKNEQKEKKRRQYPFNQDKPTKMTCTV